MNRQTLNRIARNVLAAGLEDACWEGYEAVGLKDQGGVQVPNCVPVKTARTYDPLGWSKALEDYVFANPLSSGDRWNIVKMTHDEFKVEAVNSVLYLHAKAYEVDWSPDPVITVVGRTSQGKKFSKQIPFDNKTVPALLALMKRTKTAAAEVPVKTAGRHPLDGKRGHILLPSSIERKLPPLYSTENEPDPIVHVKFFNPYSRSNQVWLLTEYDPATNTGFGWADLGMGGGELGYIDVGELQGLQKGGLPLIERDTSWRPTPLSKAKALVR